MKYNYGSSAFSSGFVTIVLLLILSFYNTLGQTFPKVVPKVVPKVFYIPMEGEVIDDKSYIGMMAKICSEPGGKVLIIDRESNQQLLSFNNEGITKMCNYYDGDQMYENFISDSHHVLLEIVYPTDEDPNYDIEPGKITIRFENDIFSLDLIYFEIPFTKNEQISFDVGKANETEALYIPNSVITYRLESRLSFEERKMIGVQITLKKLDIDIDSGDFVLIGPGSQPTHRELSKAQIIAQKIDKEEDFKNIWVNADSAYLRLVTHNSNKRGTALIFSWKPPNNTYDEIDDTKVSPRIRNSAIQICVLDHSCQNMRVNFQDSFITELIHIANRYLVTPDHETTSLVSKQSVVLFNQEDGIRIHEDKSEIFCQLSLAITSAFDPDWPMVSYSTLHHIFFGGSTNRTMHSFEGVKVTDCSHEAFTPWKIILPIVIILIVSVLLMLIAWRYQYIQWRHSQISDANYMRTQITDTNEDTIFTNSNTKNPIFVESPMPKRKSNSITKTTDFADANLIINENIYVKQLPKPVETSTAPQNQPMANNTTNLEENLWISPSTSQDFSNQNPPEYNHHPQHQTIDVNVISDEITRDKPNIVDRSHSTLSDTIPIRIDEPITGLHGTQHESLRSYPRSVLRRPRATSENEYVIGPESGSLRFSKVQFELPKRSPLLKRDSIGNTSSYENDAFVNDC